MKTNYHEKILFRVYNNILEKYTVETLWGIRQKNASHYEIDSIPFYATIACGDIVLAEYDEDEQTTAFKEILEHSGNSTVQVIILTETLEINSLRNLLNRMGCESEALDSKYFTINVPYNIQYTPVKNKLQELEDLGQIGYAEPVLSSKHSGE